MLSLTGWCYAIAISFYAQAGPVLVASDESFCVPRGNQAVECLVDCISATIMGERMRYPSSREPTPAPGRTA